MAAAASALPVIITVAPPSAMKDVSLGEGELSGGVREIQSQPEIEVGCSSLCQ